MGLGRPLASIATNVNTATVTLLVSSLVGSRRQGSIRMAGLICGGGGHASMARGFSHSSRNAVIRRAPSAPSIAR